jgi:hypothetical protein
VKWNDHSGGWVNASVLPLIETEVALSMRPITNAQISSILDLDHGEGWITFSWSDASGIDRSLTIDADGHCSREMPIRSGTGVSIVSVRRDHVRLRFTDELASKLELDHEIEFEGTVSENTYKELLCLAEYF